MAIPGNVTLSETGDGTNTILQLGGDNEIASSAAMTFSTPVGYARLELNGHAQTVASINGNSHATIEGLYDNTGLNSRQHADGQQRRRLHVRGVIRDSTQGSGTGKVNLVKSGGGDLVLSGTNLYTGSTTVNGGTLQVTGSIQSSSRRQRRFRGHALLQPLRRFPRLRRPDHRLGHGADLPRGARLLGGHGRQHLAERLQRHGERH